jgi:riboflavin kinase/FMN adenylyltransferase
MGKTFLIKGIVVKGTMMGRKINFPTINIAYNFLEMPFGVYVSRVYTSLGAYKGALHFGPRSVLGIKEPSLEVHLLDFSGDLYGQEVKIEVFEKIRDVKNFENMNGLKRQIRLDVETVRMMEIK